MHRSLLPLAFVSILAAEAQPQLRLELGFHAGSIKSLATDSAERYLATASDDKTVRVWDISTGRQLSVLRPPIGEVDEGKMYAAAITPDGATIAAGGWTGPETHSIYIFDRASGRIERRIPGLPGVTLHLAYSPDGRYLLAALGDGGIRLYRVSDYGLAGEDKAYQGSATWAAFSTTFAKDRRLATTAEDLYVRMYRVLPGGGLELLRKRISERKEEPISLAFSPDGASLAVCFDYDTYPVSEVWNPRTLARLYPIEAGTLGGIVTRVAWSADGKFLYGAGGLGFWHSQVVRWDQRGRGDPQLVEIGDDEENSDIPELLPLRNGSLLLATGRPALGMLDRNWKPVRLQTAPITDYLGLDLNKAFLLSEDGKSLRFAYRQQARAPAWFSVPKRLLALGEAAAGFAGKPPDEDSLEVMGLGTAEIQLNRKYLELLDGEIGTAAADVPGGHQLLLATKWRLLLFDSEGKEQWQISLPAVGQAVNVSGDGRLAVAALRDGTIRWYRLSDGKELLAFFPHPDRKRWILWTPEGYYDCSPGAEELFGFHTNRGDDQAADFEPAAKLRSRYYRPEIVSQALE